MIWNILQHLWNVLIRFLSHQRRRELLDQRLLKATKARRRAFKIVRRGAKNGAIDKETGLTALHFAAENHDLDLMKCLVYQTGADINCTSIIKQDTTLHCSLNSYYCIPDEIKLPFVNILKFMLEAGADVNARNSEGQTALHIALSRDPIGVSRLDEMNDLENLKAKLRWHYLCVVKTLFERGARPDTDARGWSPWHYMSGFSVLYINEYASLLQQVCRQTNVNIQDNHGCTPLHVACLTGNFEGVRWCLEGGADVNARDEQGRRPLHLVCDHPFSFTKGFISSFQIPYLSRRNDRCMDVLARFLIAHGADPLATTKAGENSFAIACRRRNLELMKAVAAFQESAIVNARVNSDEETCLHIECRSPKGLAKELLLTFTVDPNVLDCRKHTSMDVALATDNLKYIPFLSYKGGTSRQQLSQEKIHEIYKMSTESFLNFLKHHRPNLFPPGSTTKAFILAAKSIESYELKDDSEEIHAYVHTAIKFRKRFRRRLPNGGDAAHRHFVKVLKDCEYILWPPQMPLAYFCGLAGVERVNESFSTTDNFWGNDGPSEFALLSIDVEPLQKTEMDDEQHSAGSEEMSEEMDGHGQWNGVLSPQEDWLGEEDEEYYYPLSVFFDEEGACIDEEDIGSMDTQGFFES